MATNPVDVLAALRELEAATDRGLWAAGFLAYEAAAAFGLTVRPPQTGLPLLWFGLYREAAPASAPRVVAASPVGPWQPELDAPLHARALATLQERIASGDTYQVNFTFPLRARLAADPWAFFSSLFHTQRPGYAAYLDTGRFVVASVSPELFFDWRRGPTADPAHEGHGSERRQRPKRTTLEPQPSPPRRRTGPRTS